MTSLPSTAPVAMMSKQQITYHSFRGIISTGWIAGKSKGVLYTIVHRCVGIVCPPADLTDSIPDWREIGAREKQRNMFWHVPNHKPTVNTEGSTKINMRVRKNHGNTFKDLQQRFQKEQIVIPAHHITFSQACVQHKNYKYSSITKSFIHSKDTPAEAVHEAD